MRTQKKYSKPLELLDKFIANTTPRELAELISSIDKLDIKGPTFDEYLEILQDEMEGAYSNSIVEVVFPIEMNSVYRFQNEDWEWFYSPPPDRKKNHEKDSVKYSESFFLL